jgi:hypothetical protein
MRGFLLPFSLISATYRDAALRRVYVRLTGYRLALLMLVGAIAIASGEISSVRETPHRANAPGIHLGSLSINVGPDSTANARAASTVPAAARAGPTSASPLRATKGDSESDSESAEQGQDAPEPSAEVVLPAVPQTMSWVARLWQRIRDTWSWILALVAVLSAAEGVLVFFSRRFDDWLSHHASRLVEIIPEEATAQKPALAWDPKWLWRKVKRRARGYMVFAAGLPLLLPLRIIPFAGSWIFSASVTAWGWYWLGVFTAAKSAHAWIDEDAARPPQMIRTLNERVASGGRATAPLRWYGRTWAHLTRGVNPVTTTFERAPAAFLGLALARALLAMPGLYLLARPIVPVAAGRICADADPRKRSAPQLELQGAQMQALPENADSTHGAVAKP